MAGAVARQPGAPVPPVALAGFAGVAVRWWRSPPPPPSAPRWAAARALTRQRAPRRRARPPRPPPGIAATVRAERAGRGRRRRRLARPHEQAGVRPLRDARATVRLPAVRGRCARRFRERGGLKVVMLRPRRDRLRGWYRGDARRSRAGFDAPERSGRPPRRRTRACSTIVPRPPSAPPTPVPRASTLASSECPTPTESSRVRRCSTPIRWEVTPSGFVYRLQKRADPPPSAAAAPSPPRRSAPSTSTAFDDVRLKAAARTATSYKPALALP